MSGRPHEHRGPSAGRTGGFTLVELLVVMGILAGFLMMLVQLVDGGLRLFRDGELGQQLADRTSRAQRVITAELDRLRGSASGREREIVDDRLVVQLLPIGLPAMPERNATRVQVLRGAVRLDVDRELVIVEALLAARIFAEDPTRSPEAVAELVAGQKQKEPLRGVGNLLLVPWRQEGPDDALLELRAGWFLPGQKFPVRQDHWVDPFEVPVPGSPDLPSVLVYEITESILKDLLHVEFALWGQSTTSWGGEAGPLTEADSGTAGGGAGQTRPFAVWDSARGGWLIDKPSGGVFALDRGPWSEHDPRDDVHPHAILVRCVVAQPAEAVPEGLLANDLGPDDNALALYDGTRFPGPPDGGWIKLSGEWLRYGELVGDRLVGLRRGQRATKPLEHPAGTRVHVGRTVEFVVPILHAKDDWNG